MNTRLIVLSVCFAATALFLQRMSRSEAVLPRQSFESFPIDVGGWTATRAADIDPDVLRVLGVTEHVNRYYSHGDRTVHLYVGYYATQREGSTMHSPMNCLPGAGWAPLAADRLVLGAPNTAARSPVAVNRVVIEKGLDRQLVLYWYHSHGRVVPSEYWSRLYLVLDAIRLNRTDAALVRVIAPFRDSDLRPAETAERDAAAFAASVLPLLERFLPS